MTCRFTSSPSPLSCPACTRRRCGSYERLGLVSPGRSAGRGRRYSMRDILALREIQRLSQEEGVNLAGIKRLLDQLQELEQARGLIAELHAEIAQLRVELESTRAVAARLAGLRRAAATAIRPGAGAPCPPGGDLGTGEQAVRRDGAGRRRQVAGRSGRSRAEPEETSNWRPARTGRPGRDK